MNLFALLKQILLQVNSITRSAPTLLIRCSTLKHHADKTPWTGRELKVISSQEAPESICMLTTSCPLADPASFLYRYQQCLYQQKAVIAGACALQDLPVHLLYKVSRQLDFNSQRDLIMCSPQLYSRLQLHVAEHHHWHFVHEGLSLLEIAATDGNQCTRGQIRLASTQHCPASLHACAVGSAQNFVCTARLIVQILILNWQV